MKFIHSFSMTSVFEAIRQERQYQDAKWGSVLERPHTAGEWLLIIKGELDEAIHAWQKGQGNEDALREVLQVASVSVACLQNCGIVERIEQLPQLQMEGRKGQ